MKHPLRFGMASYAWRFDEEAFSGIKDYRVETGREYPVRVAEKDSTDPWGGSSREVGVAPVHGTPGAFEVEFEAGASGGSIPRFYSVWRVDKDGVANLSEILMATGPYTAR